MAKNNNKRKRTEKQNTAEEQEKPSSTTGTEELGEEDRSKDSKPNKLAKESFMDDIDDLFASKKERVKEEKQSQQEDERREMEKRKFFKNNNNSSSALMQNAKKIALAGDRSDCALKKNEWVDDGRGGVFDAEGFTGRKEDGVKVFKAHLFNKKGFGTTKDCPFDCDCCFV